MINILGIVIARKSEIEKLKENSRCQGYTTGKESAYKIARISTFTRISPRTGLPVRKYNKRK